MPKVITRDRLIATIQKFDGLWKVPEPYVWKLDHTKRRVYFLTCKCGKSKWVAWRKIVQGECLGCRSCRRKTHGMRYDPIYLSWHGLRKKRVEMVPEWQRSWKTFYKWAKPLYAKGWKLIRVDSKLPYGPDNCDYVPICRKRIEVASTSNVLTLPIGRVEETTLPYIYAVAE